MNRTRTLAGALLAAFVLATPSASEEPEGVYIVFDGSGSMWGQLADGTHKIEAAREVLGTFAGGDFGDRELALRVYGHRREGDCGDTELAVPFAPTGEAAAAMRAFVEKVNPRGKTPIHRSLAAALEDFGGRSGEIILISDGIETCDADPCELVRQWREGNVAIRVHVVGLGLQDAERAAMECISRAAGTEYQDAGSAAELAAGLERIQRTAVGHALVIEATRADGEPIEVEGTVRRAGEEPVAVASHRKNRVPPGTYTLEVGVPTRNGTLYRPVARNVTVRESGETAVELVVEEPPSIQVRFMEIGEDARGSQVTAFRDGTEVFAFRWIDRVYVEPGTYALHAKPNADNDLRVTITVEPGEHKEAHFELVQTVHAKIRMVAAGSGLDFRQNYELWQDGEKRYGVHWGNGVKALPGTYELHLPSELTPHVHALTLSTEESQEIRVEVPAGHVTVRYQKADGSAIESERIWLSRLEGGEKAGRKVRGSDEKIPLTPGTYTLEGWSRLGDFDEVVFEVRAGEDQEIPLRSKS